MNLSTLSSFLAIVCLAAGTGLHAQEPQGTPAEGAPKPGEIPVIAEEAPPAPPTGENHEPETGTPASSPPLLKGDEAIKPEPKPELESPPTGDAEAFAVPQEMAVFSGHVGRWKGMTKTAITEKGKETITRTRSEWTGGYLLGGHAFEMRGFSYGTLGRTEYRWQYTYDTLKERYMAAYYDSHGRTHFCEGKINLENTKIIWRLIAPPGDMTWHVETDLQPENGIETNGQIKSEKFDYDMVYSSVFRRS